MTFKIVVVASHPIQYQVPFYKVLAQEKEIELTVLFCSDCGLEAYYDKDFEQEIKWDIPLLEGYNHKFFKNWSLKPNPSTFWGLINPDVISYLRKNKFDAVLLHGWNSFTNWLVFFWAPLNGLSVLLRSETNLLPIISPFKRFLKHVILSSLFKNVSGFLAIGKYNEDFYKDYGVKQEKIYFVPYAVNNDFFLSKAEELIPKKQKLKEKYEVSKDLPVILFSGKLTEVKKPFDLLKAYAKLQDEKKSNLIFLGEGPLKKELEKFTFDKNLENVKFVGFKNQTEISEFYAMADVLVLPSEYEPWGLVVNEAMCFSLPIIVSDKVGAGGNLVKDKVNGYIYPSGNTLALKEALRRVLFDHEKSEMGYKSLEIVKKWSYKEGVEGILNCLKSIRKI